QVTLQQYSRKIDGDRTHHGYTHVLQENGKRQEPPPRESCQGFYQRLSCKAARETKPFNPMNTFTVLFLVTLAVSFAIEWWLSHRQLAYVREHRNAVPEAFKDTITLEAHQKAADYTTDKARLGNVDRIIGLIILLLFTVGGGID